MSSITVSIAILAYNHEKYIKRALESVLSQKTNFIFEIVIGEDSSTDKTRNIVLEYKKKYPEIIKVILHVENVGGSRNYCDVIEKCEGKYIALLESDDYWTDDTRIQRQVDFLEQKLEFIAVSHVVQGKNVNGDVVGIYPHRKFIGKEFKVDDFIFGNSFPLMGMMFRNLKELKPKWDLVCKGPRNMGDFTISIAILDSGRVYIMDSIMAVYNIKKSKEETNYNSMYNWEQKYIQMVKIINLNSQYYNGKYDFSYWYSYATTIALLYAVRYFELREFMNIFNEIPQKNRGKLFRIMMKVLVKEITSKISRLWAGWGNN